MTNRRPSEKRVDATVWKGSGWAVVCGRLVPQRGRPPKTRHLFQYVAEKLPFACLSEIKKCMNEEADTIEGVYMAHDSMGIARYGGRGQIFSRLEAHKKRYPLQLLYFSF